MSASVRLGNVHAGTGAGKFRKPYRIREYLDSQGTNMKRVADELGVNPSLVRDTIRGVKNNRRVLSKLQDMGCPERYLSLPKDMQEK